MKKPVDLEDDELTNDELEDVRAAEAELEAAAKPKKLKRGEQLRRAQLASAPRPATVRPTSLWLNRPRDGFSSAMGARAAEMSSSREGRLVNGGPRI